jgi:very-short-patch-repair endonuclease
MASSALTSTTARDDLLVARARYMLAHPTASEALLFSALRGNRLGVSFRRQQVVLGSFVVDFLARDAKVVVEVDGDSYHQGRSAADAARERKLIRAGYTVVRLPASLVERDLPRAAGLVQQALARAVATRAAA